MKLKWAVAMGGVLGLAGCDAVSQFQQARALQELRQECFGNFTNSCVSKTIDYNIGLVEAVPFAAPEDKQAILAMFGDAGWDLYEQAVREVKDDVVSALEASRPGMFSRWILGDAQPFDGKGVMEFSQSELEPIRKRISEVYIARIKAAGLTPNAQAMAHYSAASQPATSTVIAPEQQPAVQPAGATDALLKVAIDQMVADEIATDGGSEYDEGRQLLEVDLDGDGVEDAVVLYTIEGQGGGNGSFQTLAALYRDGNSWSAKGKTILGGATDLQLLGPNLIGVTVLTHSDEDPRCCPSQESVVKYQWNGAAFAELPDTVKSAG